MCKMASEENHHPKKSSSPFSDTACPTPESFTLETKFIVLNFMGRNPHDGHPGCVYSSTTSSTGSDSIPFCFKSKKERHSFPTSPRKHTELQRLGQLNSPFHTSEDNVNYKYEKEHKKLLSNDSSNEVFHNDHNKKGKPYRSLSGDKIHKTKHLKSLSLDQGLSKGRYFLNSDSSPMTEFDGQITSVSTPFENYRHLRTESEMSSDTNNLSYTSDADDEYDSTPSSLFSSFSDFGGRVSKQGDSHIQRMSVLMSESEVETDLSTVAGDISADMVDGNEDIHHEEDSIFHEDKEKQAALKKMDNGDNNNIQKMDEHLTLTQLFDPEILNPISTPETFDSGSMSIDISTGHGSNSTSKSADRSKLRLVIKSQQEWEEEQRYKLEKVAATVEDEINTEIETLESEVEEAIRRNVIAPRESPFTAPMSPHTEAAITLARIGDEIKDYYGDRLTAAVSGLCGEEQISVSYEEFKCMACSVIDQVLPGWRQVALLLVYGQSVAWRIAEFGYREFGELVNNTVRLISELSADFITSQGGWGAVVSYESSLSSSISPHHSSPEDLSPRQTPDRPISDTSSSSPSFNHVICQRNNLLRGQGLFFPTPDESASDQIISVTHCDIGDPSGDEHGTVSLADIHMTFSQSDETTDNNVTFKPLNELNRSHMTFIPEPDESAMFININDLKNISLMEGSSEDVHDITSDNNMFHEETYQNCELYNEACGGNISSFDIPVSQWSSTLNQSLLQKKHSSNQLPSIGGEKDSNGSLISNSDCLTCNKSEPAETNSEDNLDSDSHTICTDDSANNNSMLQDTQFITSSIPTLDLSEEEFLEYGEDYNNSDNDNDLTYTESYNDMPINNEFFDRFFNIGTLVSLGVCAIGIMVTIASSRR